MDANKQLEEILKQSESLPFLFVGSGLPLRYLSTENWPDLLRHFASMIDSSDYAYEKYETKAAQVLLEQHKSKTKNNLMTCTADLIERDFNTIWFESALFEESRSEFKSEIKQGISPFKLEISKHFRSIDLTDIPTEYLSEITLLKEIGKKSIAGVISTNYDCFLQSLYPDYSVYVGQEELLFSPTYGIGEIYKIHGCCTKPDSIVINSRDYEDFERKNSYLAAKLMTIFVEHPIIFLGYSLDDENIQAIIKSIVDCLSEDNLEKLKNRLIFVQWDSNAEQMEVSTHSRDFGHGKAINMTKVRTDSFEPLLKVVAENKAKYATRMFRKVKQEIYELALTNKPTEKIMVMPLSEEQMDEEPEVVIGFGILEVARQGYRGIPAEKIFLDVVFDRGNYTPKLLVEETLPTLLKQVAYSLPVFKYISNYPTALPPEFKKFEEQTFEDFVTQTNKKNREKFKFKSINEVLEKEPDSLTRQVRYIQTLEESQIDITKMESYLREVLTENPDILTGPNGEAKSGVKKLIRIYDFLKYKGH
ncbi:SIR2 family protein [Effusibacillus consociatus]|uniref:SIR2 family protein n=1 Tax=Effusibacillus consociatus TaxID=1117041 RepID=A0ABV9Q4H8_9BACL